MNFSNLLVDVNTRSKRLSAHGSDGGQSMSCSNGGPAYSSHFVLLLTLVWTIAACDTTPGESLYDPDRDFMPDPVVERIEPESALAGIGTLTIFGENFAVDPSDNVVFFGSVQAEVIEASPTQLVVSTPNLPGDDIDVRVSVIGAELVSNTISYRLDPAVERFGAITDFEEVFGIATDDEGNLYMSLFSSNVSAGIKRLTPEGVRSDYISSTFQWNDLDFDSQGRLYGVRNVRAVFRFPAGGGNPETWAVADDAAARFRAVEVDPEGNVWVGGGGGNVYRISPNAEFTAFPVEESVTSIEVADGFLYLGLAGDPSSVVRYDIQNGSLDNESLIFTAPAGVDVLSLALGEGGEVLVGTDDDDPIFLVEPDGTTETFYAALLDPSAARLAWGDGAVLYMVRGRAGGTTPDLIRINTPFEGAR